MTVRLPSRLAERRLSLADQPTFIYPLEDLRGVAERLVEVQRSEVPVAIRSASGGRLSVRVASAGVRAVLGEPTRDGIGVDVPLLFVLEPRTGIGSDQYDISADLGTASSGATWVRLIANAGVTIAKQMRPGPHA
ncbi:MAG: hypothetical protein QM770_08990 [Tepidisphaeraceae bacterium]